MARYARVCGNEVDVGIPEWMRYRTRNSLGREHRAALRYLASGHTRAETAQHTGLSPRTIQRLATSHAGRKYIATVRAALDAAAREQRLALELEREASEQ